MIKHSFQDLINLRQDFDELVIRLGLKIKTTDRIHQAFDFIEWAENERKGSEGAKEFMTNSLRRKKFYFSLADISELQEILKHSEEINPPTLKEKLHKYMKGNILPSEENTNNNEAKNIGFELRLVSKFLSDGYDVTYGQNNPDILVKVDGIKYYIECKRIFSESKIEAAISDGKNQLDGLLVNDDCFGIIAVSFSRIKVVEDMMMLCKDEADARRRMDGLLATFIAQKQKYWKQISNKKIIAVLLHFSSLIGFDDDTPISTSNFIGLNNVFNEDENFIKLAWDFRRLKTY